MRLGHTRPCNACPWRRASAPGYLGQYTPQDFIGSVDAEVPLPCHKALEGLEEEEAEEYMAEDAPYCAGALVYMRNTGKSPRDIVLREARQGVGPNRENVFSTPGEFLAHHNKESQ